MTTTDLQKECEHDWVYEKTYKRTCQKCDKTQHWNWQLPQGGWADAI